jgi:hypothetical protein
LFKTVLCAGVASLGAACGAGVATSSPRAARATNPPIVTAPTTVDPLRAWQRFAACMSTHTGVHVVVMPPPHYGVRIFLPARANRTPATPAEQAAFETRTRAANATCHHFLQAIQKTSTSSQDEAKFRDQALAFARCMRRHGVNVGDPIIKKVVGGFDLSWPPAPGVSLGGPRWETAAKACRSLNPIMNGG